MVVDPQAWPRLIREEDAGKESVRLEVECDDAFVLHLVAKSDEPSADTIQMGGVTFTVPGGTIEVWTYLDEEPVRRLLRAAQDWLAEGTPGLMVEADEICVLVWEKEDHPVGYGADKLDEVYGPFKSWDEAHAFEQGLQLPAGQFFTSQVLRLPKLSPHGVQPEDFRG